ncbi:hypothetical protein, partial [Reyranella sp.]|uniref:hypothetical protein n=1 Tax=Reyranella sp. TaxID=1929291 RepID=UPI003D0ED1D1
QSIAQDGSSGGVVHVAPHVFTVEAMLSAAFDTLHDSLRRCRFDSIAVGYSRNGTLRLERDLGKPWARHGIGLSRSALRARGVDFWYEIAFRPFCMRHGELTASGPMVSASVVAVDCTTRPGRCLGMLGLILTHGFVALPATLVAVDAAGPSFIYHTNVTAY